MLTTFYLPSNCAALRNNRVIVSHSENRKPYLRGFTKLSNENILKD
ncbi:MAG: hypothetical protein XD89_0711 [Anaerolineae bacterium 49_20]|jgi:hypothetical protein|nr:MAG: hypothetical protein XD89_0711 [Anaerolineae bacterium 49_20]